MLCRQEIKNKGAISPTCMKSYCLTDIGGGGPGINESVFHCSAREAMLPHKRSQGTFPYKQASTVLTI